MLWFPLDLAYLLVACLPYFDLMSTKSHRVYFGAVTFGVVLVMHGFSNGGNASAKPAVRLSSTAPAVCIPACRIQKIEIAAGSCCQAQIEGLGQLLARGSSLPASVDYCRLVTVICCRQQTVSLLVA